MIGITGVSIAPELSLHYHDKGGSFASKVCCCCVDKPEEGERMYIDEKMRVIRWRDKKGCNGEAASHGRLKLAVVKTFQKISHDAFKDAEDAFRLARIEWEKSQPIYREDLDRLNTAVARIKSNILDNPLSEV